MCLNGCIFKSVFKLSAYFSIGGMSVCVGVGVGVGG